MDPIGQDLKLVTRQWVLRALTLKARLIISLWSQKIALIKVYLHRRPRTTMVILQLQLVTIRH